MKVFFFFFSSRRRHTRCLSDWSSDVCSSDLLCGKAMRFECSTTTWPPGVSRDEQSRKSSPRSYSSVRARSEERRVGKECSSQWSPENYRKKYRKRRVEFKK